MSAEITSERVCYVQCNFCNTILAVSVPCSSAIVAIVTVRCGHCSNLLSVNLGALLQSPPPPLVHHHLLQDHFQLQQQKQQQYMNSNHHMPEPHLVNKDINNGSSSSSSSSSFKADLFGPFRAQFPQQSKMPLPVRPPEKRQRVPSAYNRFIKEEIQRIKTSNREISHREAFSMAAKNWAHFPHIHFGRKLESNKQAAANKMKNVENGDHGSAHHQHKSLGLY